MSIVYPGAAEDDFLTVCCRAAIAQRAVPVFCKTCLYLLPLVVKLAIKPQEAFYAGAKFQKLTNGSYEDAMQQAKEVNADFIIVDKNIDNICPGFKAMVKEQDLEIFSTEFESSNRRIVIYKLKGSAG